MYFFFGVERWTILCICGFRKPPVTLGVKQREKSGSEYLIISTMLIYFTVSFYTSRFEKHLFDYFESHVCALKNATCLYVCQLLFLGTRV